MKIRILFVTLFFVAFAHASQVKTIVCQRDDSDIYSNWFSGSFVSTRSNNTYKATFTGGFTVTEVARAAVTHSFVPFKDVSGWLRNDSDWVSINFTRDSTFTTDGLILSLQFNTRKPPSKFNAILHSRQNAYRSICRFVN